MLVERPDFVDCGDMGWLRRYERSRIGEVVALQSTTHALQQLFQPQSPTLSWLRNSGLNLVNALPVVRSSLARYALD
jgi:2-polyprenyl-6-methoxyphenol hydroxylase-like FAD-dependent oxidoreductase